MKINKTTFFLFIALLAVWVTIGCLVFSALKQPKRSAENSTVKKGVGPIKQKEEDFTLLLNYETPFKSTIGKHLKTGIRKTDELKEKPTPVAPIVKPKFKEATINYLGVIRTKNKKQAILLKVAGNEQVLFIDELIDGYQIKKVTEDSLVLVKKSMVRVITRN